MDELEEPLFAVDERGPDSDDLRRVLENIRAHEAAWAAGERRRLARYGGDPICFARIRLPCCTSTSRSGCDRMSLNG
jgi:hypothetical protein